MKEVRYTVQEWRDVPAELDWLTPGERLRYDGFRFEKRRRDWLLGRWAAKVAVLAVAGLSDQDITRIEVATSPDGAPLPRLDGEPYRISLSLSHSNDRAFAAATSGIDALGCDIELVEPRGNGFVETYFTAAEIERVGRAAQEARDLLVTMIWSAKESTLKALHTGLRVDTRSVEVIDAGEHVEAGWNKAHTIAADGREFGCLWRRDGSFVLTAAMQKRDRLPVTKGPAWMPDPVIVRSEEPQIAVSPRA